MKTLRLLTAALLVRGAAALDEPRRRDVSHTMPSRAPKGVPKDGSRDRLAAGGSETEKPENSTVVFCKDKKGGLSIPFLEAKLSEKPIVLFHKKPGDLDAKEFSIDSSSMEALKLSSVVLSEPLSFRQTNALYSMLDGLSGYKKIAMVRIYARPSIQLGDERVVRMGCVKQEVICEEDASSSQGPSGTPVSSLIDAVKACKPVRQAHLKDHMKFSTQQSPWAQNLILNPSTNKFEIVRAVTVSMQPSILEMITERTQVSITELSPLDRETVENIKAAVEAHPSSFFHVESDTPRGWLLFLAVYFSLRPEEAIKAGSPIDRLVVLLSPYIPPLAEGSPLRNVLTDDVVKAKLFLSESAPSSAPAAQDPSLSAGSPSAEIRHPSPPAHEVHRYSPHSEGPSIPELYAPEPRESRKDSAPSGRYPDSHAPSDVYAPSLGRKTPKEDFSDIRINPSDSGPIFPDSVPYPGDMRVSSALSQRRPPSDSRPRRRRAPRTDDDAEPSDYSRGPRRRRPRRASRSESEYYSEDDLDKRSRSRYSRSA